MTAYMIYTTNDTEPIIVKTDEDLIDTFLRTIELGEKGIFIQHTKEMVGGTFKYNVALNVENIVSITTKEKID